MVANSYVKAANIPGGATPKSGARSAVPRHTEISNILCRKIAKDLGIDVP